MNISVVFHKVVRRLINYTAFFLSDESFLKLKFRWCVGYRLDLVNPRTYNEKLQWLKLNDQHSEYGQMVDKVEAKKYVANIIGKDHIIPTIGVWNSVDDINWAELPSRFVIKCSGDSGGVVVCKDLSKLNVQEAKKRLLSGWSHNYYRFNKEYPYKDIVPRIIAEEYMEDESGFELKDYKFFCFDGEPKILFVASDRQKKGEETKFDFYDIEWNHLPFTNGHPNSNSIIDKPKNFDTMLTIAKRLSKGIPHVRVDLYNCRGKIFFGELTFFHWSGMVPFEPIEWDYKLGEWIHLPAKQSVC